MQQTTGRVPRTRSELEALRAQRQELTSQLDEVTARRGRLGQERLNARARGDMAMVQEYDARISELGARETELSRAQLAAERLIAEAVANGVGQRTEVGEPRVITLPGGQQIGLPIGIGASGSLVSQRQLNEQKQFYQQMLLAEAAGFILLGAIVARWAWHRGRRAVGRGDSADVAGLRTSVDAIAIEVERISENQRYVTKLLTEGGAQPLAQRAADASLSRKDKP